MLLQLQYEILWINLRVAWESESVRESHSARHFRCDSETTINKKLLVCDWLEGRASFKNLQKQESTLCPVFNAQTSDQSL